MNIAVIFAGGTGQRMNTKSKPKQFLEIHGKPVIIYTLENFQNHPLIDGIVVVCLQSWIPYCQNLISKFGISKVKAIVSGGSTGQESIFHGIKKSCELFGENTILLIHDGVRPLIDESTITHCIETVEEKGNAITVSPAIETIFEKKDGSNKVGRIMRRSQCMMAKAPQCFWAKDIYRAHLLAIRDNKTDFIDSADLMQHYGFKLFMVEGAADNIKITTPSDFYTFRAIMDARESYQILGL